MNTTTRALPLGKTRLNLVSTPEPRAGLLARAAGALSVRLGGAIQRDYRDTAAPARVDETMNWTGRALLWSFVAMVIAPTAAAMIYFGAIASDQYVGETRVAARAASEEKQALSDTLSAFGKLGLSAGKATAQDSYIVLNYIKSRGIIEDIGGRAYLEAKFARPDIDVLARLQHDSSIEDLWKYWNGRVSATIDTISGIVTVKVFAFRPEDAREISQRIVERAELLVNKVSERARAAAVAEAERDVARNERELATARGAIQDFRNRTSGIDPVAKATSIGGLIGKLMVERGEIEKTIATLVGSLAGDSPATRFQKSRMEAIDNQIAALQRQLTSTDARTNTVAGDLATFEQLKLAEQFAERKYTLAQTSLDRASRDLRGQKLFLAVIVPPGLPENALYPERLLNVLLSFVLTFIAWSIASLFGASIADHLA